MRISDWSSDVCSSDLNDNLIISKLDKNPTGLGIFGFSYLDANKDKIKAVPVQGVAPTYATIADGSYPGSRPLFIYVKKAHVGVVPGLADYVAEFLKGAAEGGYLAAKGLLVSPKDRSEERRVGNEWVSTCKTRWVWCY